MPVPPCERPGTAESQLQDQLDTAGAFSELRDLLLAQQKIILQHLDKQDQNIHCILETISPSGGHAFSYDAVHEDVTSESPEDASRPENESLFKSSQTCEDLSLKHEAGNRRRPHVPDCETQHESKTCIQSVVGHMYFEILFGFVLISNTMCIGVEVSAYRNDAETETTRLVFTAATYIYGFLFTFELVMRALCHGKSLFCSTGWLWNVFDCFIVLFSLWEVVAAILVEVSGGHQDTMVGGVTAVRIVRISRVTRMLRIAKIARLIRFMKGLRTLVASIAHTLKSLFWAMVLLLLIMYVFAILFVQAVADHVTDMEEVHADDWEEEGFDLYWADVLPSMVTLFMCITSGVNYEQPLIPLRKMHWVWALIFLFHVFFSYLAVLNVITGVFCSSAIESAASDRDMAMQELQDNRKSTITKLRDLLVSIDVDESGSISFRELERHIHSPDAQPYFELLELDIQDTWAFFKLLERNGDATVDIDVFLEGCMNLRGTAKALDLARLHHDQQWLMRRQSAFMSFVEDSLRKVLATQAPKRPASWQNTQPRRNQADYATNKLAFDEDAIYRLAF